MFFGSGEKNMIYCNGTTVVKSFDGRYERWFACGFYGNFMKGFYNPSSKLVFHARTRSIRVVPNGLWGVVSGSNWSRRLVRNRSSNASTSTELAFHQTVICFNLTHQSKQTEPIAFLFIFGSVVWFESDLTKHCRKRANPWTVNIELTYISA